MEAGRAIYDGGRGSTAILKQHLRGSELHWSNTGARPQCLIKSVSTFPTTWSDKATTTHFLSRSKANTYTQCEPDHVLTGAGTIHLTEFAYQLKCAGQWEAVEWVLKPTPNGFQKRLSFTFAPNRSPENEAQQAGWSQGLFVAMHSWMFRTHTDRLQVCSNGGPALSMWYTVRRTVGEWIEEKQRQVVKINRWFLVELNFAFSDVLRFSFVAMRYASFCKSICPALRGIDQGPEIDAHEMAAAIRKWHRQLCMHHGYYKYMADKTNVTAASSGKHEQALANTMEQAEPVHVLKPANVLAGVDLLKHEMLKHPKLDGLFSTDDARRAVRKRLPDKGGMGLADHVRSACSELQDVGFLERGGEAAKLIIERVHEFIATKMSLWGH